MVLCLALLSLVILSGCTSKERKKEFCESIGYEDWNWINRVSGDYTFFCYNVDCNNVTTSRMFLNINEAQIYRGCNYKRNVDLPCNTP